MVPYHFVLINKFSLRIQFLLVTTVCKNVNFGTLFYPYVILAAYVCIAGCMNTNVMRSIVQSLCVRQISVGSLSNPLAQLGFRLEQCWFINEVRLLMLLKVKCAHITLNVVCHSVLCCRRSNSKNGCLWKSYQVEICVFNLASPGTGCGDRQKQTACEEWNVTVLMPTSKHTHHTGSNDKCCVYSNPIRDAQFQWVQIGISSCHMFGTLPRSRTK